MLVGPESGRVLLMPRGGVDGVLVVFRSNDASLLEAHGTFGNVPGAPASTVLGLPIFRTDVFGIAHLGYELRAEPANGQGDVNAAVARIDAGIDLRLLVVAQYSIVEPALWQLIWGERVLIGILVLEWHEDQATQPPLAPGRFIVDLTGPRPGAGHYEGAADSLCVHTPGTAKWTAVAQPSGSGVTQIDLGAASGFDTVSVSTAPTNDFSGLWFFRADSPETFAEVVGDGSTNPPTVRGIARFTDTEGRAFTAGVTVSCSQTF